MSWHMLLNSEQNNFEPLWTERILSHNEQQPVLEGFCMTYGIICYKDIHVMGIQKYIH